MKTNKEAIKKQKPYGLFVFVLNNCYLFGLNQQTLIVQKVKCILRAMLFLYKNNLVSKKTKKVHIAHWLFRSWFWTNFTLSVTLIINSYLRQSHKKIQFLRFVH